MRSVEAEGRTIEEAVAEALKQLQVEREQAEIEILSQATKGLLGIGGQKARGRATLRVPLARKLEPEAESLRPREGRRGVTIPSPSPADEDETVLPPREMRDRACAVLKEVIHLMNIEGEPSCDIHEGEAVITIAGCAVHLFLHSFPTRRSSD